ncbi:MAG: ATP-binding protein [Bdellovibrionota bacterium]
MTSRKAIFREILDENLLPIADPYVNREIGEVPAIIGKASVLLGARRAGKSSYLHQVRFAWLSRGVPEMAIGYMNFDDDRLFDVRASDLAALAEAFDERVARLDVKPKRSVLLLDEIQNIDGWELFVSRLLRQPGRTVYLTGSSARLLSREVASSMRGRALAHEIFPFSFREVIISREKSSVNPSPARVQSLFRAYLKRGGFPEVQHLAEREASAILRDYAEAMLLKDVVERHKVTNIPLVKHLFFLLLNQTGSLYTINKLYQRLRAAGLRGEKALVSDAIGWFEDCYALFSVPSYSESYSRQAVNPRKIYAIDPGLARAISVGRSENDGHLLETTIFLHLRRKSTQVFYYRFRTTGLETDFFTPELGLIQVTADISAPETRKRELIALGDAMAELRLSSARLVTLDERGEARVGKGKVEIIRAADFCLETSLK